MTHPQWRKSSFSGPDTNCVELADAGNEILVRDTKDNGTGPVLHISRSEMAALVAAIKAGHYDELT